MISINTNKDNFDDFISFIDDDNIQKEWYVQIEQVGDAFVTFTTKNGNSVSIPSKRVIKIKRKRSSGTYGTP